MRDRRVRALRGARRLKSQAPEYVSAGSKASECELSAAPALQYDPRDRYWNDRRRGSVLHFRFRQ